MATEMQHTPGPWIWLQDDEVEGRAECGCELHRVYDMTDNPAIVFCPLHEAAPKMLAVLRYAQDKSCDRCGDCLICLTLEEVSE